MAKDGTSRGGKRPGQGRPSKALKDKVENGNPGHRPLKVVDQSGKVKERVGPLPKAPALPKVAALPEAPEITVEEGVSPRDYMSDPQNKRNGEFYAKTIFEETMAWLDKTGCAKLVEREVVDLYAVSAARWIQCERAISEMSLLAPHPTTKVPIASPYSALSNQYSKTMMTCWYTLSQIVKENSLVDYREDNPQDNIMEKLLKSRGGM